MFSQSLKQDFLFAGQTLSMRRRTFDGLTLDKHDSRLV